MSFSLDTFEEVDEPTLAPLPPPPRSGGFSAWVNADSRTGGAIPVGQRLSPMLGAGTSTTNGSAYTHAASNPSTYIQHSASPQPSPSLFNPNKRMRLDDSFAQPVAPLRSPYLPFPAASLPSGSISAASISSFAQPSPPLQPPRQLPTYPKAFGNYLPPRASASPLPSPSVASGGRIPVVTGSSGRAGQRPPMQAYRSTSNGIIDLTASGGEDSDIEITGSTLPQRASDDDEVILDDSPVCIGQITSLALIMYAIPEITGRPASQVAPGHRSPGLMGPLHVRVTRSNALGTNETLRLATFTGSENFAVVEHRVGNVIGPFLGAVGAGHGAILSLESIVQRKGEVNPMMLPLTILLFTRPQHIRIIANALEQAAIFLEHPLKYDPAEHQGARYSNPHNTIRTSGDADRRRREMLGNMGGAGYHYSQRSAARTVEAQQEQVQAVFQSLRSGVDMEEVEPPPEVVHTKLYRHQKQALSFLLDRERLRTVEGLDATATTSSTAVSVEDEDDDKLISLWKRKTDAYGRIAGWLNVVTAVETTSNAPPPQCRGAILADDMGLGKTIVLISLIASTLTEALAFAQSKPLRDRDTSHFDAIAVHPHHSTVKPVTAAAFAAQPHGMLGTAPQKKKKETKTQIKREEADANQRARLTVRSRATLIICPLSTIQNWESQIDEHAGKRKTLDGTTRGLSVYIYHGPSRTNDPIELVDYDVVLTTFSTVGSEYSKMIKAENQKAEEQLAAQADAESSDGLEEVDATGEPVHPKPSSSKLNGASYFKSKLGASCTEPNTPSVSEDDDKKGPKKRKRTARANAAPLQMVEWFRIVLDEAHMIKEHSTIQAKAACDLAAERRTCLTGTPLQNQLDDLFSLMRFLRLEPFTDRAIWNAYIGSPAKLGDKLGVSRLQLVMRHLALRRTKFSKDADGKPILDLPRRKDELVYLELNEREKAFYTSHHSRYRKNFLELEQTDTLLKNYCSILQELLRLRQICVHADLVRESEDANRGGDGDIISAIAKDGISIPRALQLFALMRDTGAAQCAECGCELVPVDGGDVREEIEDDDMSAMKPAKKRGGKGKAKAVKEEGEAGSTGPRRILTRCTHLFCLGCFRRNVCDEYPDTVSAGTRSQCSICRTEISPVLDAVEIRMADLERMALVDAEDGGGLDGKKKGKGKAATSGEMSTKIHSLLEDLVPFSQANPASSNYCHDEQAFAHYKEEDDAFRPHRGEVVKSVVFSQWTKLLDKIGEGFDQCGIRYARLDGGMSRVERSKSMEAFKAEPACEILLVSLRAGGVGLNLTAAQRVYLMEPFWNPAVEQQALDRVHRLGQTKPVKTMRLVVKDSIEANMLIIQKRKQDLANLSLSATMSKQELARQRVEDLRTLLQ